MTTKTTFTLRLNNDTRARLKELSDRTGLSESALASLAVEAAIAAADAAGGYLVVPIEFRAARIATSIDTAPNYPRSMPPSLPLNDSETPPTKP